LTALANLTVFAAEFHWQNGIVAFWMIVLTVGSYRAYRRTINRRAALRESNYEAAVWWFVDQEDVTKRVPPSPELDAHEDIGAELAEQTRNARKAQGRGPDGNLLPDPNSQRSRKRAAQRARRVAAHREEIEQRLESKTDPLFLGRDMDVHPMDVRYY
jgi:hypothetical protein